MNSLAHASHHCNMASTDARDMDDAVWRAEDGDYEASETTPLVEAQPRPAPMEVAITREEFLERLARWEPIAANLINPSEIDYSVFPGGAQAFWAGSIMSADAKHRMELRREFIKAVESDDAPRLERLLRLPMRIACCSVPSVLPRSPLTFAPGELMARPSIVPRRPSLGSIKQSFKAEEWQTRAAATWMRPPKALPALLCMFTLFLILLDQLGSAWQCSHRTPSGSLHDQCQVAFAIGIAIALLPILYLFVAWYHGISCGPLCTGPRYRQLGFEFVHELHRTMLRLCGPRYYWAICQSYHDKSASMISDGSCTCGPAYCQRFWPCTWNPCVCFCFSWYWCYSMVPEVYHFMMRQHLLELEIDEPNRSVLRIAAEHGHPDVLKLLHPYGVDHVVAAVARDRFQKAQEALHATKNVAADFAAALFERLHTQILANHTAYVVAFDAPSEYQPPAPKPCQRDGHVPSRNTGCAKCQMRAMCESQDPFAAAFMRLHIAGADAKIRWANSDARRWSTRGCHIELAKLFCPPLGSHEHALTKTRFELLDGTAVFNMLSWCVSVPESIRGPNGAAQEAVKARNLLKHTDELHLTADMYDSIIDGLVRFLECIEASEDTTAAAKAQATLVRVRGLSCRRNRAQQPAESPVRAPPAIYE